MFSKAKSDNRDSETVATAKQPPSLLSSDLKIEGNILTDGEVHLEGVVIGDVAAGRLTIGEQARVQGEIVADDVTVMGEVQGQIRAVSVRLAKTAKMVGDIWHQVLAIDSGARMEGHCRRVEDSAVLRRKSDSGTRPDTRPDTLGKSITETSGSGEKPSVVQRKPSDPVVLKKAAST